MRLHGIDVLHACAVPHTSTDAPTDAFQATSATGSQPSGLNAPSPNVSSGVLAAATDPLDIVPAAAVPVPLHYAEPSSNASTRWGTAAAGRAPSQAVLSRLRNQAALLLPPTSGLDAIACPTRHATTCSHTAVAVRVVYAPRGVDTVGSDGSQACGCERNEGEACSARADVVLAAQTRVSSHDVPRDEVGGRNEGRRPVVCVTMPAAWGHVLLPQFEKASATVVGRAEQRASQVARLLPSFPFDFVSCPGYWCAAVSRGCPISVLCGYLISAEHGWRTW